MLTIELSIVLRPLYFQFIEFHVVRSSFSPHGLLQAADLRRDIGLADSQQFGDFLVVVPVQIKDHQRFVQRVEFFDPLVEHAVLLPTGFPVSSIASSKCPLPGTTCRVRTSRADRTKWQR